MKLDDYSRIEKIISEMSFRSKIKSEAFCANATELFEVKWQRDGGWRLLDSSANGEDQAFIFSGGQKQFCVLYYFGSEAMHICLEFRHSDEQPIAWAFNQNTHRRNSSERPYLMLEHFIEKMPKADIKSFSAFIKRLPHDSAPFSLLESWIRE